MKELASDTLPTVGNTCPLLKSIDRSLIKLPGYIFFVHRCPVFNRFKNGAPEPNKFSVISTGFGKVKMSQVENTDVATVGRIWPQNWTDTP
jgi:hypothetical protein